MTVETSGNPAEIATSDALVLPGVGAFGECVRNSEPFHDVLREAADDTPILGIRVGLQLLYTERTEGAPEGETTPRLNLLDGRVERLAGDVKLPQMGWNELRIERDHPVADGLADGDYAYFVHSYAAEPTDETVATCDYGGRFAAVAANEAGNVVGTQFHPEKSGETGLRLLDNFVRFAESYTDAVPVR